MPELDRTGQDGNAGRASPSPISWKRNLVFVWLSQFFSIAGFGFGLPFAPYYIQQLGVTEDAAVKMWTAFFQAGAPLMLAVMSPVWGMLADRYGRRLMMLRANFGGAVVLYLMGTAPSVEWLIAFRLMQGMFTGTMTAAQTLVATTTPDRRQGMALGTLITAVHSGLATGALLGGLCGEVFGYAAAFKIGSGLLVLSALLIVLAVREQFEPPKSVTRKRRKPWKWRLPRLGPGMPVLVLIFAMSFARRFLMPILPLFVQALHGGRLAGSGIRTGALLGLGSLACICAGPLMGRLVDRFAAPRVAAVSAVGAGLLTAALGLAGGYVTLCGLHFVMLFFAVGLDPVFQVWLSRVTTPERRGAIFGWAVTAKSSAWVVSPLLSGVLAVQLGDWFARHGFVDWESVVRGVAVNLPADWTLFFLGALGRLLRLDLRVGFFLSGAAFLLLIPLISWATRRMLADPANNGMAADGRAASSS